MAIHFFHIDTSFKFTSRRLLKEFIHDIFISNRVILKSLNIIFCTDSYLLEINKKFLQHDNYTDIITFNLAEPRKPIEGEIFISYDRVVENAQMFTTPLDQELHRIIFHGCLHLCGFKDKKAGEKAEMRRKEDDCLLKYFSKVSST